MTFDYSPVAQSATTAISEYGVAVTLRKITQTVNPAAPWENSTETTTDYSCRGLLKGVEYKLINGTTILSTDEMLTIGGSDLSVTPTTNDTVIIGGTSYSVVAYMPLKPGGTVVLHKIVVRAA